MFVRRLLSRMSRRYGNFTGTRLKLCGPAAPPRVAKIIQIEVTCRASASRAAKVLNFAEDAHTKNMSTFEADEHLWVFSREMLSVADLHVGDVLAHSAISEAVGGILCWHVPQPNLAPLGPAFPLTTTL